MPLALRATRSVLGPLSHVAPGAVARTASWMFTRTMRRPRPANEQDLLVQADPFRVRSGRHVLRAWRWGDSERVVLLVHGWSGRGAQLGSFVEPLLEAGYSVVTWDGPGHGASPGSSSSLVELADACFAVARHLRITPAGIIAHSMGASAAAVAIAEGLPFGRAAFVAPPASIMTFVRDLSDVLRLDGRVVPGIERDIERRYGVRMSDLEVESVGVPHGERVFVVHDRNDREVPFEHGERVANALNAATFLATDGLGHRRILADAAVIRRCVDWIGAPAD